MLDPLCGGYFGSCLKGKRVNSPPLLFRRNYKRYELFSMHEIMIVAMDTEQLKRFWNKNKFSDFFTLMTSSNIEQVSVVLNILFFSFYKLSLYLH